MIDLTDQKKSADDNCLLAEGRSRGEAWHGAETANRREDSLIDDPALHNRQLSGCLTRPAGDASRCSRGSDESNLKFLLSAET